MKIGHLSFSIFMDRLYPNQTTRMLHSPATGLLLMTCQINLEMFKRSGKQMAKKTGQ